MKYKLRLKNQNSMKMTKINKTVNHYVQPQNVHTLKYEESGKILTTISGIIKRLFRCWRRLLTHYHRFLCGKSKAKANCRLGQTPSPAMDKGIPRYPQFQSEVFPIQESPCPAGRGIAVRLIVHFDSDDFYFSKNLSPPAPFLHLFREGLQTTSPQVYGGIKMCSGNLIYRFKEAAI